MHVHLIRHAESTWNAEDRWQGQADPPLSAAGRRQAAVVAARLAPVAFDAVVSSDLSRAVETAAPIAAGRGLDLATDVGLRELHVGTWAGLTSSQIEERFPDEWRAYRAGEDIPRGGGESLAAMHARVVAAFEALLDRSREEGWHHLAVVSHGGCVRAVAMHALGIADRTQAPLPLAAPSNTAITEVAPWRDGRLRLLVYNDAAHLLGGGDTALG